MGDLTISAANVHIFLHYIMPAKTADIGKKVKASRTRYRALGPELIPVYKQSARRRLTISHPPGGRLPLLSARPAVTFPAAEHHRPLAGTTLYRLCEQLARGCCAAFAPGRI